MQEIWVWSHGQEDPLKKETATHSSILAWEIPWSEEPGRLHYLGLQKSRHDLATRQHKADYAQNPPSLQQHVNWEPTYVQTGFRKGRGTRDQIANICWIIEKAREFQKNIYFCFTDYTKAFDCVDHKTMENS